MSDLPSIAGKPTIDPEEFEHRCRVLIQEEQEKIAPDIVIVEVLCEAVRFARQFPTTQ